MEIILFALLALSILAYLLYVRIVTQRNKVLEALAGVDVQLTKRHDLIPNVLAIAKRFMEHESSLLEEITALRGAAMTGYDPRKIDEIRHHLETVQSLETRLAQLMVNVENYPQLKSDQTMLEAQRSYRDVEEQIAAARRFYNAAVGALNNSVQIFPGNLIARWIAITAMPFYEANATHREPIAAANLL